MTTPTVSILSNTNTLVEGGQNAQVTLKFSEPLPTAQEFWLKMEGTAGINGSRQTITFREIGGEIVSSFELPDGHSLAAPLQPIAGGGFYLVTQQNTPSQSRQFEIFKFDSTGAHIPGFADDGALPISISQPSYYDSQTPPPRIVFSEDGRIVVAVDGVAKVYDQLGSLQTSIPLATHSSAFSGTYVLGASDQGIYIAVPQNYSNATVKLIGYSGTPMGSLDGVPLNSMPVDVIQQSYSSPSYSVANNGALVIRASNEVTTILPLSDGNLQRLGPQNLSGDYIEHDGKFYRIENGDLQVLDSRSGQPASIVSLPDEFANARLIGVGSSGELLIGWQGGANPSGISNLPASAGVIAKLNPTSSPVGGYNIDSTFGTDGYAVVPSSDIGSTYSYNRAFVNGEFVSLSNQYQSDVWMHSSSPGTMVSSSMWDSNVGAMVVRISVMPGTTEAMIELQPATDRNVEATESLKLSLIPNSMGGSGYVTFNIDEQYNTVDFSIQDGLQTTADVDLSGPEVLGVSTHDTSPASFYPQYSPAPGAPQTFGRATSNFYNATIGSGVEGVEAIRISVSKEFIREDQDIDFRFGYASETVDEYGEVTASSSNLPYISDQPSMLMYGEFRLKLGDPDAIDKTFFFQQSLEGGVRYFTVRQEYSASDPEKIEITLRTADGGQISAYEAQRSLNMMGFGYSDPAMASLNEHAVILKAEVSISQDGDTWSSTAGLENDAEFRFMNYAPEAGAAVYNKQFIEITFEGPPDFGRGGLADSISSDWVGEFGMPAPSLFTVQVKSNGAALDGFEVIDVLQERSLLLVLNKEIPSGAEVTVSYADPDGNQILNVAQTWDGLDAASFADLPVNNVGNLSSSEVVLPGAEYGWNTIEQEYAYLPADWSNSDAFAKVVSKTSSSATIQITPLPWLENPHFVESATSGIASREFASLRYELVVDTGGGSSPLPMVGAEIPVVDLLSSTGGYRVYSWKLSLLTATADSAQLGADVTDAAAKIHELVQYTVSSPLPVSLITSSGFGLHDRMSVGGSSSDLLGSPFATGDAIIKAGDGDDTLMGGFGADLLDGGKGNDTLRIFGNSSDYTIQQTDANKFTITPKNAQLAGGVDQIISVERVIFDDKIEMLDSEDPSSFTTVTPLATAMALIQGQGGFDYLDIRSLISQSGLRSYDLDAASYASDGSLMLSSGVEQKFAGFEGYIVSGLAASALNDNPIRVLGLDELNEVVLVAAGKGLSINLGESANDLDVISFRGTESAVTINIGSTDAAGFVNFNNGAGASEVAGADAVFGSEGGDVITGFADRSNLLAGYSGDDTLVGGSASDLLFGGAGADVIRAGAGDDTLVDLDNASQLEGGAGKDLFVVRGAEGDLARISDLEVSPDGLTRGGINSKNFVDRIAFNFSTAAFANTSIAQSLQAGGELAASAYRDLRNAITLKVMEVPDTAGKGFEITALLALDSPAGGEAIVLGKIRFDIAGSLGANESLKAVKLAQDFNFMKQFDQAILDQLLFDQSPIAVASAPNGLPQMSTPLSDTVTLFFAVEKADKFTISPAPGENKPVLVPVIVNGIEVATRFQPGNGNEKLVGSRAADTYQYVKSEFIDANGDSETNQSFGQDVIIERGSRLDAPAPAAGQARDDSGRDLFSLADPVTMTGLRVEDLLVGDLELTRMQRGREGQFNSLRVEYQDSVPDVNSMNAMDTVIFRQYMTTDASFRVEDLQLIDGGSVTKFDLGASYVSGSSQGLKTVDARDAILVSRGGAADHFVLENTAAIEPDRIFDVYFDDFDAGLDKVELKGYGAKISETAGNLLVNGLDFGDSLTLTMGGATSATTDDYTIKLHFMGATLPPQEDWLLVS